MPQFPIELPQQGKEEFETGSAIYKSLNCFKAGTLSTCLSLTLFLEVNNLQYLQIYSKYVQYLLKYIEYINMLCQVELLQNWHPLYLPPLTLSSWQWNIVNICKHVQIIFNICIQNTLNIFIPYARLN